MSSILYPNVAVPNTLPEAEIVARTPATLVFSNWSLFAQDTWKATRTLTVTYGLRWEYNAAPSSPDGTLPFTVTQVDNFATMTLAPPGTPLWHAQKDDFAPRLGLAWQPLPNLVLRAGAGFFYDLGYSAVADGTQRIPIQSEQGCSQYLISADRCSGRAASFYDNSTGFIPCGRRSESRLTQNV